MAGNEIESTYPGLIKVQVEASGQLSRAGSANCAPQHSDAERHSQKDQKSSTGSKIEREISAIRKRLQILENNIQEL